MRTRARFVLWFGLSAAAVVCAGGCTTAAVVSAGTMVGLAASAASTGADVYRLGKLDAADEAQFDDWIDSVLDAADELDLKVTREVDNGKGEWRCTLRDDRGSKIKVTVQRRTEAICRTRIDVGWFGSEPTARLLLGLVRLYQDSTGSDASPFDVSSPDVVELARPPASRGQYARRGDVGASVDAGTIQLSSVSGGSPRVRRLDAPAEKKQ